MNILCTGKKVFLRKKEGRPCFLETHAPLTYFPQYILHTRITCVLKHLTWISILSIRVPFYIFNNRPNFGTKVAKLFRVRTETELTSYNQIDFDGPWIKSWIPEILYQSLETNKMSTEKC